MPGGGIDAKDPGSAIGITDPTLPRSSGDGNVYVPEKINFNFYKIFFNEALANPKNPCDELKRDLEASKDKQKNGNPEQQAEAKKSQKNIEQALKDCCISVGGGGGGGKAGSG